MVPCSNQVSYLPDGTEYSGIAGPVVKVCCVRTLPGGFQQNVYLVLNLMIAGCVSPQYHCQINDFFETTCHGGPDISGTIFWQQLAGLSLATKILSEVSAPTPPSIMSKETPSDEAVPLDRVSFAPPLYEIPLDNYSVSDGLSHVTENAQQPHMIWVSPQAEGAIPVEPTVTAGTSLRGQVCTMSQRMADSVLQQTFFGN
jgi:hypothetical protein